MTTWIETLPSGRYRARYRDADGTRHSQSFDRKADAKAFLASVVTDMARGEWRDPRGGAVPFREWADKWFATRVVRATTQAADVGRYRTHLLPAFGDVELKDLTPLRIKTFVAQLSAKCKPATVRHVHALLSTILNDAVAEGLLLTNPCRFSRLPRARRGTKRSTSPRRGRAPGRRDRPGVPRPRRHRGRDGHALGRVRGVEAPAGRSAPPPPAGDRCPRAPTGRLNERTRVHVARGRTAAPPQLLGAHLAPRRGRGRPRPDAALPRPPPHARRDAHLGRRPDEGDPGAPRHSSIIMTMDRYGHLLADVDDALLAVLDQRLQG